MLKKLAILIIQLLAMVFVVFLVNLFFHCVLDKNFNIQNWFSQNTHINPIGCLVIGLFFFVQFKKSQKND